MITRGTPPSLDVLRRRLQDLGSPRRRAVLPFGVPVIDMRLPDGGLALGALHEVAGGAAAVLFAAGIAARTRGRVLWCASRQDLFAPGLAAAGLKPDRVIYVEAEDEKSALACCEEGLRHGGSLGAVVTEVARLSMMASRRLQLAAEGSGAIGLAIRSRSAFHCTQDHSDLFADPTAAVTRWRVSALPSAPLPVTGVGRARWRLDLVRCRGGEAACFDVEACDAQGRLSVPAHMVGPGQAATGRQRATR